MICAGWNIPPETMSGKGSEVGRTFEELRAILDKVELKNKMGVCLDTCHIWDGGYDIVNHPKLRQLPFFLEPPNELDGYAREIAMMREAYQEAR